MKNKHLNYIAITLFAAFNLPSNQMNAQNVNDSLQFKNHEQQRIQSMIDNTHVLTVGGVEIPKDSIDDVLNKFYFDQFRHFQDPRAPYFMFMSKSGNLALGVGGQVKVKGYYDWNGSIPSPDFVPYLIPIPKNPAAMRNLSASASGTGLFFTLLGKNSILGDFMAYFQADFSGYNRRGFRIKKAYLTAGDWTAGYAVSTFEDTKAEPPTVDGAGPNGINSKKNVLVRYMHTFKKKWTIAASVEFPSESITPVEEESEACTTYVPDFAAFAQYQWGGGASHLRLSGLLRTLTYRDLLTNHNYNITGWGLQLSTVINVYSPLTLFGIISVGKGHESYTTDLGNDDLDLIPDYGRPGRLFPPFATGYVIGVEYYFTPKIFANAAFSEQRYYPHSVYLPQDNDIYKYGLYAVGNIFWDITPRFEVGLEYLYGKRKNMGGEAGSANRIMAQMVLSF